jgi:methylmalonyl-CoA mutase N-terminal domain/subunit
VDPVAGSWAIERLTDDIEDEAQRILDRIDRLGGTLVAIEQGVIQRDIQESAYQTQLAIDRGGQIVVGVNRYQEETPRPVDVLRIDPSVETRQVERVRAVRASRSATRCAASLADVEAAARDGRNLVPPILGAVESLATVGEIADAMRRVFGEYRETPLG